MSNEDIHIIREVLKGNKNSFEIIMDKYKVKLFRYILKLVQNENIAEEMLQETFIKAYNNLEKFDQNKEFSVWIMRIARNSVLDYFRKEKRSKQYEFKENIDSQVTCKTYDIPHEAVEKQEIIKVIDETINSLPDKYKTLIIMKYFEELNYDQMAERLDISKDKVKWRLHQARKRMAKELKSIKNPEIGGEVYGM